MAGMRAAQKSFLCERRNMNGSNGLMNAFDTGPSDEDARDLTKLESLVQSLQAKAER